MYTLIHQAYEAKDEGLTQLFFRTLGSRNEEDVASFMQAMELSFILRRIKALGLTNLMTPFELSGPGSDQWLINTAAASLSGGTSTSPSLTTTTTGTTGTTSVTLTTPAMSKNLGAVLLTEPIPSTSKFNPALSHIRRKLVEILSKYMGIGEPELVQMLQMLWRQRVVTELGKSGTKALPFIANFLVGLLTEVQTLRRKIDTVQKAEDRYRERTTKESAKEHQRYPIRVV